MIPCEQCARFTKDLEELRAQCEILHFRISAVVPLNRPGGLAFIPIVARLREVLTTPGITDAERVKRIDAILNEVAP